MSRSRSVSLGSAHSGHSGGSQPSSVLSSDYEIFQPSDTPPQYDAADDDREWEVDDIVSEEIDLQRRKRYQVSWADWKREDGTTTTWHTTLPGNNDTIQRWNNNTSKRRLSAAKSSQDVDLSVIFGYMPHDVHTAENSVAYQEKLNRWKRFPLPQSDWDTEIGEVKRLRELADLKGSDGDNHNRKRKRQASTMGHSASKTPVISQNRLPNRLVNLSSGKELAAATKPPRTRLSLETGWLRASRRAGAASLKIVNDIDAEEFPPVADDFIYLEKSCMYDTDVQTPEQQSEFLSGCECHQKCGSILKCSCLSDSDCRDDDDEPSTAYSDEGLFLFTRQQEVVECNEICSCGPKCRNRVAQKPRDIPLEIFKTANHGWGVRASVDIPKGKVLGLYTGKVMRKEVADRLSAEEQEYTFALDTRVDDPDCLHHYTISAYKMGNWTRFVNHSCDPTAQVYTVVIDTPVMANMPYVAYAANKLIERGTEITIDYQPKDAALLLNNKGKGKGKIPKGRTHCLCGSALCRGWF